MMTDTDTPPTRRTKRRFAHELYPEGDSYETFDLEGEVPRLYARAIGLQVDGTGWFEAPPAISTSRTMVLVAAREHALLADALLQGLTGQEAWQWAESRADDETGEVVYERAVHYGVDPEAIRPYACGEPETRHRHLGEPDSRGARRVTFVDGPEAECDECTEPIPADA